MAKEKKVDAEVEGKEEEEVTLEEPVIGEEEAVLTTENDPAPEPEKKKEKKKDKVMDAGKNVKTVNSAGVVFVNRAAIVYLAKHILAPPDLEDFKTAFPTLF